MGEIDEKPFHNACKERFPEDPLLHASTQCSLWQEKLKNPAWHPFKVIDVDGNAKVFFFLPPLLVNNWKVESLIVWYDA